MDGHDESSSFGGKMSLTLGLATLNEEGTIPNSLGALLSEMDRSGEEAELIVVAGGRDSTVDTVKAMLHGKPRTRIVVDTDPKGKPAALNVIFSLCRGNIVVLSDGDVVVGSGAVKSLLKMFDDPEVGCASGRVVGGQGEYNGVMRASSLISDLMHLSRKELQESGRSLDLASGYLLAVRKSLIDQIPHGINSDDGYISLLVLSKGHKIAYAEDAIVRINFPKNVSDFIKQKMRTRYGHMELEDHFGDGSGRTVFSELRDLVKHLKTARRRDSYGWRTVALALFLIAVCWFYAYLRRVAPPLFSSAVWKPIESTK